MSISRFNQDKSFYNLIISIEVILMYGLVKIACILQSDVNALYFFKIRI